MEEKIYAIKAYDGIYSGLHGMSDYAIIKGKFSDAYDTGIDMSYEVMDSYGQFYEIFSLLKLQNRDLKGRNLMIISMNVLKRMLPMRFMK